MRGGKGGGKIRERRAERADSVRAAIACRGASLPRGKYCTSSKLHPTPLIRTQVSSRVGNALIASQLGQHCDSLIRLSSHNSQDQSACIRATTTSSQLACATTSACHRTIPLAGCRNVFGGPRRAVRKRADVYRSGVWTAMGIRKASIDRRRDPRNAACYSGKADVKELF